MKSQRNLILSVSGRAGSPSKNRVVRKNKRRRGQRPSRSETLKISESSSNFFVNLDRLFNAYGIKIEGLGVGVILGR